MLAVNTRIWDGSHPHHLELVGPSETVYLSVEPGRVQEERRAPIDHSVLPFPLQDLGVYEVGIDATTLPCVDESGTLAAAEGTSEPGLI
jgi:hypothetical protein